MTSALATACNSFSEVRRSLVIVGLKVRSCRTERTELEFANWSSEHELSRARSLVCGAVRKIIIGSGTCSSRPNCSSLKLDILHTRRQQQNRKKTFNHIVNKPEHCLHYLLPTAIEQSVTDRLRSANKLPRIFAKTNRFRNSFICYSLNSLECE